MKKLVFLIAMTFVLTACNQNLEKTKTNDEVETVGTIEPKTDENDEEKTDVEPHSVVSPSEVFTQLETKIKDRLNASHFIMGVDYRVSDFDFNLLNSLGSKEVQMIGQGEMLNNYYIWYSPEEMNAAMRENYGFTIDFENYRHTNEQDFTQIYYDGDFVYLVAADYPGFNGVEEVVINSIEQVEDLPIYYTELQYKQFSFSDYEQAGHEWDPALWETPMDQWPEEMQEFIKLDETKIYALFVGSESNFALSYYQATSLSKEERMEYIEGLQW